MTNNDVITETPYHRAVSGPLLVQRREAIGLTQTRFAELAGWTQQYQSWLELPGLHEVTIDTAATIKKILQK